MFTKIIDIVFRQKEAQFPENNKGDGIAESIISLVWFSIMLYLVLSVI